MAPSTRSKTRRSTPNPPPTHKRKSKPTLRNTELTGPIPARKTTALEESNALYALSTAAHKAEKAHSSQPDCQICFEPFSTVRMPYGCPNEKCHARFCEGCRDRQIKTGDVRCPFCRLGISEEFVVRGLTEKIAAWEEMMRARGHAVV